MKKLFAILTLALFIGGISAPVFAADNNETTAIEMADKDPKKDKKDKKSKSDKKSDAKKSSECSTEKKSDCSKSCGG